MLEIITSPTSFFVLLSLFFIGGTGSLLLRKDDALANIWSSFFAIAGSLWGLLFSLTTIISGHTLSFVVGASPLALLSFSLRIDMLSAFFTFIISLIGLFCSIYGVGYIKQYYKKYNIGALGFFYNVLLASLFLVVTTSNALFFLIAWEIMSISSYFLVVYDRNDEDNIKAGFLYLAMTYVGTAFIVLAFLLMYKFTGSFDFETIKRGAIFIPLFIKNAVFIIAMIGFGTKAGIVPFHIWLPAAHPAAPSHVSALMSGVMIKTGIFMMMRLFLDMLQPVPVWWGLAVLAIGSISSLLGVLYALTEHDIKRLLAYHSIENIGIILLGLGSAMAFYSLGMPSLALLSFVASLFHTLNHAIFKSLLFLGAGSVINQMHTRNMEEYGGLITHMPQTAFFFLIGSMAISALPPFNGFFSEWLTFQSLFQGIVSLDFPARWIFVLASGALVFTGGLALACFVKVFGVTFLARPRSAEVAHTKESSSSLLIGMGALATLSLLLGIFSSQLTFFIEKVGNSFTIFQGTPSLVSLSKGQALTVGDGFASVSGPAFLIFFLVAIFIVIFITQSVISRRQKITIGATWDCGTDMTPRMEITATGFARSIVLIFKGILKPNIQSEIEYHDPETRYLLKPRTVILSVRDIHQSYFYEPLHAMVDALSLRAKKMQGGNINAYISYIFIALLIVLFATL
ncbi:MAG: hydrogenase 4 subunit B [Candidatus Ryanbacteria bacterium RIFCSPHIGHO2_01_FULL_48_27]|uniref:Hydrogenase 4 subunit B n=1 Tax=Candidatus Ryanbacteria bacterium RIFCSPHIGHO2_01_FULL_48_27 TaxID=1802115 RepID=A0A1G2G783_9BACT|nr:MAG: hydrogenase 4 subunit B [Candidatus Ryanbacteria bacterium RIFCSPHIGHO2_01_FULL_48_27]